MHPRECRASVPGGPDPRALHNNYDVRIAAARVQEARANFVVTRSDLYRTRLRCRRREEQAYARHPGGARRSRTEPPATSRRHPHHVVELRHLGPIRRSTEAARRPPGPETPGRRMVTLVSDLAKSYFELLALDVHSRSPATAGMPTQHTFDLFRIASRWASPRARDVPGSGASGGRGEHPAARERIVAKENQIQHSAG